MANFTFPVAEIDGTKYLVQVDTTIYDKDAVTAAAYKFTDKYYIHQQINKTDEKLIDVLFEAKNGCAVNDSEVKQFCNELIDQQVRVVVNQKFGKIRDLIVEEAFRPVAK